MVRISLGRLVSHKSAGSTAARTGLRRKTHESCVQRLRLARDGGLKVWARLERGSRNP